MKKKEKKMTYSAHNCFSECSRMNFLNVDNITVFKTREIEFFKLLNLSRNCTERNQFRYLCITHVYRRIILLQPAFQKIDTFKTRHYKTLCSISDIGFFH